MEDALVTDCSSKVRPFVRSSYCASTPAPNVVLIGDSHATHLFQGFLHSGDPFFSQAMLMGAGSCWPTLDVEVRDGCNTQLSIALDTIRDTPSVMYVVLAGYYLPIDGASPALAARFLEGYLKTFSALHATGVRSIFVVDPPTLKSDPEFCLRRRPIESLFPTFFLKPGFCYGTRPDDLRTHAEYNAFVAALKKAAPAVFFYDPATKLCINGSCKVFEDAKLLYWDTHHLSVHGSRFVAADLIARVREDSMLSTSRAPLEQR
jgi:hypothetical protein